MGGKCAYATIIKRKVFLEYNFMMNMKMSKYILIIFLILIGFNANAQEQKWLDLNKNGVKDVYEDPNADLESRINDLLSRMTVHEKMQLLTETAEAIPRLGVSKYYHGNEALHGVVRPGKYTVFPQAIGIAATWNPTLVEQIATAISDEARGKWNELDQGRKQLDLFSDLLAFWSPTVNMARDPRWGRTPETYGEDPFLASRIGVSFVKGLQGNHSKYLKVVSTPKHFAANNEEHNRFEANAVIPERMLRNYYFPAFKALITEGKAQSIMTAYNAINGIPCTANKWLLTDILRNEWGFNGYVVSDCGAPGFLFTPHHYATTREEAAVMSLKAGLDLECGGYCEECHIYKDYLPEAYLSGKVTSSEINTAAFRVLRARFKLGLFDPEELNPYTKITASMIGSKEHQDLALESARQSIVLLKNNKDFLPLNINKVKKIAIIGINANSSEFGDYSGLPVNEAVTPYQGIKNRVGDKIKVSTLQWMGNLGQFQAIPDELWSVDENDDNGKGITAAYFANRDLEGTPKTRTESRILYDPANQPPDPAVTQPPMSVRWTGFLSPQTSGNYTFAVKNGYGVKLYIDNEMVIDRWWTFTTEDTVVVPLEKDKKYKVVMEYNSKDAYPYASLLWKTPNAKPNVLYANEVKLAKESDVVVAVLGINKSIEREGLDRESLDLPADQMEFLQKIYKANPKTVVVLVAGSQLSIPWISDNIPAIVNAWYPGEQGGNAIADVLFGNYNPAGRLPVTYYTSLDDLPAFDDYQVYNGRTYMYFDKKPLYSFGHGLSYTKFEYEPIKLSASTFKTNDTLTFTLNIKNVGKLAGDEVVQVYLTIAGDDEQLPMKQLKAFKRVSLKSGESQQISFSLKRDDLAYWNEELEWALLSGRYTIKIGASSDDIRQQVSFEVTNEQSTE